MTSPAWVLRATLVAGFAILMALSLPGHMSVDSTMALFEGRFLVRETFGPVVYARLLGLLDAMVPGVSLYVVLSLLLLLAALLALISLRPRTSWIAIPAAALLLASPTLVSFQGVVWKDVLFGNLVVAGFVVIAHVAQGWERARARWAGLAIAAVLFALAMSVRQNGLVAVIGAAAALGWVVWRLRGVRAGLGWSGGWLLTVVLLASLAGALAQPKSAGADKALATGLRILQHYDVVAIAALEPKAELEDIAAVRPQAAALIKARAPEAYSPERVDVFDRTPDLGPALWKTPAAVMRAQWIDSIVQHPGAYLEHRWDAWRWLFTTPTLERCLPVFVGVEGPSAKLEALGVAPRRSEKDAALQRYAGVFYGTPAYSHVFFAVLAGLVAACLLLRRERADIVMAGLMLSALAFTASYFPITIACDYRYLYLLDLAAVVGALYLALDQRGILALGPRIHATSELHR